MLPSQRDKRSGQMYRLRKKLDTLLDRQFEAEQANAQIKIESDSDDDRDSITITDQPFVTSLKMTCSDSEDSAAGGSQSGHPENPLETEVMATVFGLRNDSAPSELTIAPVLNMFRKLSQQMASIEKKADRLQHHVANISNRLERVEKKVGLSLVTIEQVKDTVVMITTDQEVAVTTNPLGIDFVKISNEEKLAAFDMKLAEPEFYTMVKTWLMTKITTKDPQYRMHEAIDLLFERKFFTECSWIGGTKESPKVCFSSRAFIIKLFREIGSNKTTTLDETSVKKFLMFKLRNVANSSLMNDSSTSTNKTRKIDVT